MSRSAHSGEAVEQYLTDWIAGQNLEVKEFGPERVLADIGFDSLSIVDLAQSLKRDLGVIVPVSELAGTATVAQTVDLIVDCSARTKS